jgi:hypothetical protein
LHLFINLAAVLHISHLHIDIVISVENCRKINQKTMLESYQQGALVHFHDIIKLHQKNRFWHYGITLPSNNSNSLASHLKLNDEQYTIFMTGIGLIKIVEKEGKKIQHVIKNEWTRFLIEFGLSGTVYFDQMKVSKVPTDGIDATTAFITYRGHWLGMGTMDMFQSPTTPSSQFGFFQKPPRLSNKSHSQKLYELTMVVRKMKEDAATGGNSGDESSGQCRDSADIEFGSTDESMTLAAAENMSQFLDDYKFGRRSKEETTMIIIEAIKESIYEDRKKQLEVFIDKVVNTGVVDGDDTNSKKEEELFVDDETKRKKAPAMTRLGIPLIPDVLRLIMREIAQISNEFADKKIMEYRNWRGRVTNTVQVPVCSNERTFLQMNYKNKFIDMLPQYIRGENIDIDDGDVACWIVKRFAFSHEDKLICLLRKLGYIHSAMKMTDEVSQAMWEEANCNSKQQRIIIRFLRTVFGKKSVNLPTATKTGEVLSTSSNIGKYTSVDPVSDMCVVDKETIHYWTKPLDKVLNASMATRLFGKSDENMMNEINNVDLVLGGDHGQRKFRMVVKVVVRKGSMKAIDSWPVKIGHIDCKKDSYHVLQSTIAPHLNNDLKTIKESKLLLFKKVCGDGSTYYTCQIGKYDPTDPNAPRFVFDHGNDDDATIQFVRACSIRILFTGDLAWYAAALGKVNMSGNWCCWCKLSANEWKDVHEAGEVWTLLLMNELREQLNRKEIKDLPMNRKGIVMVELFDCVDVFEYIYPILHSEIGLGNYILNAFLTWVDYRIEMVTEEEMEKRKKFRTLIEEMEEKEEELNEYINGEGRVLVDLKIERAELKELKQSRDENGRYVHTAQQRKEIEEVIKQKNQEIKQLQEEKDRFDSALKVKKIVYQVGKAELDGYKKKRGKKGEVRVKLETQLLEYGISRPEYHGGDLTGVKVKVLLQNIDKIFLDFKTLIIGVDGRGADDDEVNSIIEMYTHLGFILDGIFSMGRTKCGELTDEIVDTTRRMIKAVLHLWRCLRMSMQGPKIHGMEDHLLEQMIRFNGIGDFTEDFVEQAHQYGVKEELRTRSLNRGKAFKSHSRWEFTSNQLGVQRAKEEVMKLSSRKRKRGTEDKKIASKLTRDERRMNSLLAVENGNYTVVEDYRKKKARYEDNT